MILLNRIILVSSLLMCLFQVSNAQQNLFDYANSLQFARYLVTSGQYDYASEEYERLFFLHPGDTVVVLEMARTYRLDVNCPKLSSLFDQLQSDKNLTPPEELNKEYLRYSLKCKILSDDYFSSSSLLQPAEKAFFDLSYYWINEKHKLAFSYNNENRELLTLHNPELFNLTNRFEQEKFKKPALAALMSAIVPGSGKAYSKRWGDALVSLLFISSNSYASYRAFKKKGSDSVHGWIFGTLAISFYSANIWGSAKASKEYNTNIKTRYQKNAEIIIFNSY